MSGLLLPVDIYAYHPYIYSKERSIGNKVHHDTVVIDPITIIYEQSYLLSIRKILK